MSPETIMIARTLLALAFVVGLIFLLAAVVKKTGLDKKLIGNPKGVRLSVVETLYLDPKHKLVLVRSGTKEHLLLIGGATELVIDSCEKSDETHA